MGKSYLIYSALYFPSAYGVERYTYSMAKKLIEDGNKVTIVTCNVFKLKEYENIEGINIYRVPCINVLKGRYPVNKLNNQSKRINKELRKNKYDLVIVNTRFYINSIVGMRFAKKMGIKCITIEHGADHLSVNNKVLDFFGALYEHVITKYGKRYCEDYYAVSSQALKWLNHFKIQGKGCLYYSIDLKRINEIIQMENNDFRKKYNIENEDIVISFVGRLINEKGILELIQAVKEVNKERKVYLFIAGSGDLERRVKASVDNRIIYLGRIKHEEVISLLYTSNIMSLPSKFEGMGISILEAIACKCFIITTERCGARDILSSSEYGSILKNNDWQNIYNSIINIIDNIEYMNMAINNSYKKLEEDYSGKKTIEILRSIN